MLPALEPVAIWHISDVPACVPQNCAPAIGVESSCREDRISPGQWCRLSHWFSALWGDSCGHVIKIGLSTFSSWKSTWFQVEYPVTHATKIHLRLQLSLFYIFLSKLFFFRNHSIHPKENHERCANRFHLKKVGLNLEISRVSTITSWSKFHPQAVMNGGEKKTISRVITPDTHL